MVGTAIFHNPSNKETIIENLLQKRNLKRMHFIQNKMCNATRVYHACDVPAPQDQTNIQCR